MLYAKKDLYALDGEVRRQIALAGQPVPKIFEKLVADSPDVTGEPAEPLVETGSPVDDVDDAAAAATPDATQAAVKVAEANGLDLSAVEGTGKDGRILESDVQALVDAGGSGE